MDTIVKLQNRLECKINSTLPTLLPNKLNTTRQGLATSGENIRNKRAICALAIIQGVAAIGGMMMKRINALVDVKRASSFNITLKLFPFLLTTHNSMKSYSFLRIGKKEVITTVIFTRLDYLRINE